MKARSEIAESQSFDIGKTVSLRMKLLLHRNETERPTEFNISVDPETTFKNLKSLIAQTTSKEKSGKWIKMVEYVTTG